MTSPRKPPISIRSPTEKPAPAARTTDPETQRISSLVAITVAAANATAERATVSTMSSKRSGSSASGVLLLFGIAFLPRRTSSFCTKRLSMFRIFFSFFGDLCLDAL